MKLLFRQKTFDHLAATFWGKTILFSLTLFFIYFSDSLLSFWAPNLIQDKLKTPVLMGLILGFSSLVGLMVDLIFPQIFKNIAVKKLLSLGIGTGMLFSLSLILGLSLPLIPVFLLGMAVWGLEYEFYTFANQTFVATQVPVESHASAWATIGIFKNLAYFLGPLIASWLIIQGEWVVGLTAIAFSLIALVLNFLTSKTQVSEIEIDLKHANVWAELKHWRVLFERIWPVIILSLTLGLIDATFWTTGAVFSEELAQQNFWGGWFLPLYQLPSLVVGFVVIKREIRQGKKRLSLLFLLFSGIVLSLLGLRTELVWLLILVLISSTLLSVSYPLVEGVYSDIVARMGREKRHLIGFSSSAIGLAYIFGPIISGGIASLVGERLTFSFLGIFTVLMAVFLLLVTPKKLKLPQTEIEKWNKR